MKVRELLEEIKTCEKEYGKEFLDWEVYTEQIHPTDRKRKIDSGWRNFTDSEEWEYFYCEGFWTKWPKKKIFTVNVNY